MLTVAGCSRPAATSVDPAATQSVQQPPPFPNPTSQTASGDLPPARPNAHAGESESLPAGTLLTVRLKNPVLTVVSNSFEAVVDEPVTVHGDELIPRGAVAGGRVEFVRTSDLRPDRGLVRLALESVHLGSVDIPLKTASLFGSRATLKNASNSTVLLEQGRRMTFRITGKVLLPKVLLPVQRFEAAR
jgi:hypothetical protein